MEDKKCLKEFSYVNDIGQLKKIVVYPQDNGKYPFEIWSIENDKFCGSGKMALDALNDFMEHYKIGYKFE